MEGCIGFELLAMNQTAQSHRFYSTTKCTKPESKPMIRLQYASLDEILNPGGRRKDIEITFTFYAEADELALFDLHTLEGARFQIFH